MLSQIKNKLIVSCQAQPNEPLSGARNMAFMAKAALNGGAVAIRACGVDDIVEIKKVNGSNTLVIGLIKRDYPDSSVYITPTLKEVEELIASKCEIIALDATLRQRPFDDKLESLLAKIHQKNILAMADISTLEEAINAEKLGFDLVSTTLSGYTDYSPKIEGPDLKLIKKAVKKLSIPVIAEGRIRDLTDLKKVLKCKPYSVVIGGAITRPQNITKRFVDVFYD